jgi:DNA-directed RNA polymerase II subunit RPB1
MSRPKFGRKFHDSIHRFRDETQQQELEKASIDVLTFTIMSFDDMKRMSVMNVCEFNKPLTTQEGALYNLKLGTINRDENCTTCKKDFKRCMGHFGLIHLNVPIYHPMFILNIKRIMNCFCYSCFEKSIERRQPNKYTLLMEEEDIENDFGNLESMHRLSAISSCSKRSCKYHVNILIFEYDEKTSTIKYRPKDDKSKGISVTLDIKKVKMFLKNIPEKIRLLIGLGNMNPGNFVLEGIPVLPTCARPYYVNDSISHDDLSNVYADMIRDNNNVFEWGSGKSGRKNITQNPVISLQNNFNAFIRNSKTDSAATKKKNKSQPLRTIIDRVDKKHGLVRGAMLGKRGDQCARSVLTPNTSIKLGEIAVPNEIADTLTVEVYVSKYTIKSIQKMILNGDVVAIEPKGKDYEIKVMLNRTIPQVRYGDKVHRKLQDGDVVIFNRQPSLHKQSMMAHTVVRTSSKSIGLHPLVCKFYNADFDGDEGNITVPQSLMARAEAIELMGVMDCLMSEQSSKSILTLIQDSMIGIYLITEEHTIDKLEWMNYAYNIKNVVTFFERFDKKNAEIQEKINVAKDKLRFLTDETEIEKMSFEIKRLEGLIMNKYSGRTILSTLFPETFQFVKHTDNGVFRIEDGFVLEGQVTKDIMSGSNRSIIQTLYDRYGGKFTGNFLWELQSIIDLYLMKKGFTISCKDCRIDNIIIEENIKTIMEDARIKAISTADPVEVNNILNAARDKVSKIVIDNTKGGINNIVEMVVSGAKGAKFNIAQIIGAVGQQNIGGAPIEYQITGDSRVIPQFKPDDPNPESRGYCTSSYIKGLTSAEFYLHAMASRVTLADTSIKTSTSGYTERRLVKTMEDLKPDGYGIIRNSEGRIVSWSYGDHGISADKIRIVNGDETFLNIQDMVSDMDI